MTLPVLADVAIIDKVIYAVKLTSSNLQDANDKDGK